MKRILLRSLQSVTRIRLGDSIPRQRHVIDPRVSYKHFFEFLVRSEPDNFLPTKSRVRANRTRPDRATLPHSLPVRAEAVTVPVASLQTWPLGPGIWV